ncbi:SRPBCC family protein [Actinomycetospora sp. NBRC 106378]|uniref:SRPBCC family protein n=1 Tax=Actinomycetospora sp. NBRC 106378 TaxID=3032208 RepID=UPI0025527FEE|nr:SRPBCC family protein [Actinomycetospora sp. NBRC 106378]
MTDDPRDPYTFADFVWVDATPHHVYDVVSDVTRHGEWSEFTRSCEWEDATSAVVGAHFTGHNSRPGREWSTRSEVVVATPGQEFAWEVRDGLVHWGFTMAPERGGTRLTQNWELRPAGREALRETFGEDGVTLRVNDAHTSIPVTLERIKKVIEG